MSELTTEYKYEVGQFVCILKTAQAGHTGRVTNRSISILGYISYTVNDWPFGEEELESYQPSQEEYMDTSQMTFEQWRSEMEKLDTRHKAARAKQLWKRLYGAARAKSYTVYCGFHGGSYDGSFVSQHDFAICGHANGWPSVWTASYDGVLRAVYWLEQQGQAPSEEERIEARAQHWQERKAIEADYIQRYW